MLGSVLTTHHHAFWRMANQTIS